jgi:lipopolysaccharide biosynthesis glycosyltransferase
LLLFSDNKYVYPLLILLHSIARHATNCPIILLNIPNWSNSKPLLSTTNINFIKSVAKNFNLSLEVKELEVSSDINLENLKTYGHISIAAYAKVIAMFGLVEEPDANLLYLDPDIIVLEGFEKIFELDAQSSTTLMARQTGGHDRFEQFWERQVIQSSSEDSHIKNWYFNAGVLKFNPHSWQKIKFWISYTDLLAKFNEFKLEVMEQDLLNALVLGNYDRLSTQYNCYPAEFIEGETKIIHFAGGRKPWHYRWRLSRLKLDSNSRKAMHLWRREEVMTLKLLKLGMNDGDFNYLLTLKSEISKGFVFALMKLSPTLEKLAIYLKS